MSSIYRNQSGDGSWSEFFGDVYSGTMVGIGHPKWYIQKTIGRGWEAITSLTQPSSTPSFHICIAETEFATHGRQDDCDLERCFTLNINKQKQFILQVY